LIGSRIAGKYLIEDHLGSGGMCDVYRARHATMGKQVAVKILKSELAADPIIAQRFEQEAMAASRIHHPHAISVIDYGQSEGHLPFIVMELVKGKTLGELLRSQGAFSVERAANILRQICGALDAAHQVGVVHRDIKPDNIIIGEYDGRDWVEVVDFGVAKIQEDMNRRSSLTGANVIVGTPRYMSPEQCNEAPVDARSDIYSLGVVLYEMLSGEAPFQGDSSTRLLVAHASEPPAPLKSKRPDIAIQIEEVVMSALSKDPAGRPQSAGEFSRRFEEAAGFGEQDRAGVVRGGAFSRINVPLGVPKEPSRQTGAPGPDTLDDDATLVRPRVTSTPVAGTPAYRDNTPPDLAGNASYSMPPRGATYGAGASDYGRRGNAGLIIGVALLLIAAATAAYIIFGQKLFGSASVGEELIEAQNSISMAYGRVDSLPEGHPLRIYLPRLLQWQGELRAYSEAADPGPQALEKARRYGQEAENIAEQARAALAALGREVPANTSQTSNANSSATPASEDKGEAEGALPVQPPPVEEKEQEPPAPEPVEEEPPQPANANRQRRPDPPVLDPIKPGNRNGNANRPIEPPAIKEIQRPAGYEIFRR
jgi:serine/threonine-protein kinase